MKKNIIIAIIVVFFLLLSAETNLLSFKIGNFSQNFSSSELAMLFFIIFSLFFIQNENLKIFYNNYKIFIIFTVIFLLSGLFSAIFSPADKIYAIKNYIRYFLFILTSFLFVYLIFINPKLKDYFYFIIFYLSIFLSLIAILEVYNSDIAEFLSNTFRDGQAVYINNKIRPAAILTHSNIFSCFMGISVITGLKLYFEKKLSKLFFFSGITFILTGLSFGNSRNAFFSFLISVLLLLFNKNYFKTIILVLIIFILTFFIYTPSTERMIKLNAELKTKTSSRILLWKSFLNMFVKYPVLGVGPGCFNKLLIYSSPEKLMELENFNIKNQALNAHNGFLNILAEFGIIGIIILLLFAIYYFIAFFKLYPLKTLSINHSLLLVVLLPFLPDAFFYSYFYMIIFFIVLLTLIQKNSSYFKP